MTRSGNGQHLRSLAPAHGPSGPVFHVVLHEPEIPNNTGNIGRTCVATGCALHLIHPLGFEVSEKACRRAGLDYWPRLNVTDHEHWPAYTSRFPAGRRWYLTTKATRTVYDAVFEPGDHFVFGKETAGLPASLLDVTPSDSRLCLPMAAGERSLNLATAACAVVYEGIRQLVARGILRLDDRSRLVLQSTQASVVTPAEDFRS